jgi:hypothetical protein
MTATFAMTETAVDYDDVTGDGRLYGLIEFTVAPGDDCADIHVEDAEGLANLRLDRSELEALIATAQRALDALAD